jgi:hypothetical protein
MTEMANTTFASEAFQSDLKGFAHEARQRAEQLHREWQAADDVKVFWRGLTGYIAKGWACHTRETIEVL